jgi:predicted nucleic acid-binding protein
MSYLFDSNCFLRLADKNCVERQIVLKAIQKLRLQNDAIYYSPQVLAEFWNVCTRPNSVRGGFAFSISQTAKKVSLIQKYFGLLPDNLSTFQE